MIHDFYAERDSRSTTKPEYEIDYILAARNTKGQINTLIMQKLQQEEERRPVKKHRRFNPDDAKNYAKDQILSKLTQKKCYPDFLPQDVSADLLPNENCCGFHFSWTLKTPFFSRGIAEFSAVDNPISRDRLTEYPCLHASGAKGMLRHTFDPVADKDRILFLFGNDREVKSQADALAGSLVSTDVFFKCEKTFQEIISPHERPTRTVKLPVFFEMVKAGASAEWSIMLFDFANRTERIRESVPIVLEHVSDLILDLGMSAKRSSGYGVGKDLKVTVTPGSALKFPASVKGTHPIEEAIKLVKEG